jgi:hypothetical protein
VDSGVPWVSQTKDKIKYREVGVIDRSYDLTVGISSH